MRIQTMPPPSLSICHHDLYYLKFTDYQRKIKAAPQQDRRVSTHSLRSNQKRRKLRGIKP
jgi:hypothetical protein